MMNNRQMNPDYQPSGQYRNSGPMPFQRGPGPMMPPQACGPRGMNDPIFNNVGDGSQDLWNNFLDLGYTRQPGEMYPPADGWGDMYRERMDPRQRGDRRRRDMPVRRPMSRDGRGSRCPGNFDPSGRDVPYRNRQGDMGDRDYRGGDYGRPAGKCGMPRRSQDDDYYPMRDGDYERPYAGDLQEWDDGRGRGYSYTYDDSMPRDVRGRGDYQGPRRD